VVVRKGQKVAATDVVVEASLAPEHLLLNIARGLGLRPEQADQQIQVEPGAQVEAGDVLAGPVGLAKRVVRAPRNGRVVLAGDGQVLLEIESPRHELKSGMPGTIIELLSDRGVLIETTGALIQGVWGNGQIDFGLMQILARSPEEELSPDQIDVSLRGAIIVGGRCSDAAVLKAAAELPLRGMVLGSLNTQLMPQAAKVPFPILVIDGLGRLPMNTAAYKLLSTSDRREVALNAEPRDEFTGTRPELIIPLPATGELPLPRDTDIFKPGQQVRIRRAPHPGKLGTIVSIRPGLAVLSNGVRALAADVRLESGEIVLLPLANLEVLS
jgi:hypothetical protein